MRVLLDACVLYPTVMREMLLGCAKAGAFTPLWSTRILGEWARAAQKLGPVGAAQAEAEIAVLRALWPDAEISADVELEQRLWLPDENDVHVLASAIKGDAMAICTMNAKDFPVRSLAVHAIGRVDPDQFMLGLMSDNSDLVVTVGAHVLNTANTMSDETWTMRKLLKKARLPRLGKALAEIQD